MKRWATALLICAALFTARFASAEETAHLTVKVDQPGAQIGPMFYGLMTEEINHSYDGGLYAELIQNRIFKDGIRRRGGQRTNPTNPPHWSVVKTGGADGSIMLDNDNPVNETALTTSLRLDWKGGGGKIGVANDGYWGIPVKPNTQYQASFYARASDGITGPLTLAIESSDGSKQYATATIPEIGKEWKKYSATLKTGDVQETADTRYVISTSGDKAGSVWFNLVSLFPPTYKNQPNGFRIDIMEKLGELKPTFLRFPGGNYVEGPDHQNYFAWKKTIGPLEERPGHETPWGYRSSDGMGLLEFLMWCEDLQMEPVLAVFAGLHIGGDRDVLTGDALKPHVQDALDEIEYITGDASTTWGARRAKDGHPAPFKLTYVEIGNEDNLSGGLPTYDERFTMFYDAIKEKYPNLQIISTIPPDGRNPKLSNLTRPPDVVDDHLYNPATGLMTRSHQHDRLSRSGPKVFMGEWASNGQGQGSPTPNMRSAMGDASFLGGLERNADLVIMQCYAPLLVNVNPGARQWQTNLIGYDTLHAFGSPSFYAQKMYSENRGDRTVPVELKLPPAQVAAAAPEPPPQAPPDSPRALRGRVGVGTWATHAEYKDIKVMAGDKVLYSVDPQNPGKGWEFGEGDWKWDGDVLRQTSDSTNCRALIGDPEWTDYTYTLKARKLDGDEGFLILFHAQGARNWVWWNVGGWGNTRSAINRARNGTERELGNPQDVTVKSNRWYDIKIEVEGRQIRCYLDGELVVERTDAPPQQGQRGPQATPAAAYANAVQDEKSKEIIVRLVNTLGSPQSVEIELQGAKSVAKEGTAIVLSGEPTDVNSVAEPKKIYPQQKSIPNAARNFVYEMPANSVNVLRIKAQ